MASFESQKIRQELIANRSTEWLPVEAQRKGWEDFAATLALPKGVIAERVQISSVSGEWVNLENDQSSGMLLWIHGGGFNAGSSRTHRKMAAHFALEIGLKVLNIDYRLAPEHPFPNALEDCLSVYRWLLENGFQAKEIVIGGDSAGAQLVLSSLISLRNAGVLLPRASVLVSP